MICDASVGFLGYCGEGEVARENVAHLDALGVDCCCARTGNRAGNLERSVLNRGEGPNRLVRAFVRFGLVERLLACL